MDDVPECKDIAWLQGFGKLYQFRDQKCKSTSTKKHSRWREVWPGAKLAPVELGDISNGLKGTIMVPHKIVKLIRSCKKNLSTVDWKLIKIHPPETDFRKVVLEVNDAALNALEGNSLPIQFGFGKYTMSI